MNAYNLRKEAKGAPRTFHCRVERNLKVFDVLDFDVFSNQRWDRLGESHAKDIVVTWPDGHETKRPPKNYFPFRLGLRV